MDSDRTDPLRDHFAGVRQPTLSPFFAARLRARLNGEQNEAIERRARWLLRVYWLVASVVTLLVVARTPWPATLQPAVLLTLAGVLVAGSLPVLLLARLRGGLFELILRLLP